MRVAVAIAVAMLALPVQAASAALPGTNGKIAFTSDREGTLDIHVMNNDGTVPNRLTPYPSDDVLAAWSPNGQQVAFSSNRVAGNESDVFIINSDGTAVRNLTPTTRSELDPTWSPDGTRLAYTVDTNPGLGPFDIFTINADQSGETNITQDAHVDREPAWSPDGARIAYTSSPGPRVFVINADGTGRTQLSNGPAGSEQDSPSWSPDGSRIAFRYEDCSVACHSDIYVMKSDGTNPVNLTNSSWVEFDPAWSPDGSKIAFASYRNGNAEIYVMNALDGSGVTRLTVNPAVDRSPDWQRVLTGYPRPRSASPVRFSLVPSYSPCAAPNRTHGAPLAFASCSPPAQTSAQATVGTPDAFGGAVNATGSLRLWAVPCNFNCFDGDIGIDLALNDVRCVPNGARCGTANASGPADYSGEMRFSFTFRLTDRFNATAPGGGTDVATVQDFTTDRAWPCTQSGSTSTGSTCDLLTSMLAIIPSSVEDGKRQIWELGGVRIYDGGADGDGDTTPDNTLFARPGVFVP